MPTGNNSPQEPLVEKLQDQAAGKVQSEITPPTQRNYRALLVQAYLVIVLVGFFFLALLASTRAYFSIDVLITQSFQAIHSTWFAALMDVISWPGFAPQALVVVTGLVVPLFLIKLPWEGWVALSAAVAAQVLNLLLKLAIRRPRPSADLVDVITELSSFSFPSGHVMFYVAFFGFLWFLAYTSLVRSWMRTLLLIVFGSLVVLVGPSRIYLGQHWASDVLAGYMAGSLILLLMIRIYLWGKARVEREEPA